MPHCEAANTVTPRATFHCRVHVSWQLTNGPDLDCLVRRVGELHFEIIELTGEQLSSELAEFSDIFLQPLRVS